jgi:hypothetical protein
MTTTAYNPPKTFAEFIERYPDHVLNWVMRQGKFPQIAHEDIAQDLLVDLMRKGTVEKYVPKYPDEAYFLWWVNFCIGRSAMVKAARVYGKNVMPEGGFVSLTDYEHSRDCSFDNFESNRLLIAGYARFSKWLLSSKYPAFIHIFDALVKGMKSKQIARKLKLNRNTIESIAKTVLERWRAGKSLDRIIFQKETHDKIKEHGCFTAKELRQPERAKTKAESPCWTDIICDYCKNPARVYRSQKERATNKHWFCNRDCYNRYQGWIPKKLNLSSVNVSTSVSLDRETKAA